MIYGLADDHSETGRQAPLTSRLECSRYSDRGRQLVTLRDGKCQGQHAGARCCTMHTVHWDYTDQAIKIPGLPVQ